VDAAAADPDGASDAGALALEWFRAYSDFLKRAAGQSAGTIDLYQELTARMMRGELAPTAPQELLTSFVQQRGAAYSDELAQLNVRFFRELVRLGSVYAQELAQALLPDTALQPAPPPAFDTTDPAGWFQELAVYSRQLATSLAGAYQALADRAAAGELGPGEVGQAASDYLQRRLPEYLTELGRLYFGLLDGLTDLRMRSEQEFLSGVLRRADATNGSESFELRLEGPLGGAASASISIENTREEPAVISYNVSEVRRADGIGAAFSLDVEFGADGFEVEPGEEARLELTLRMDEEKYTRGVPYIAVLRITGYGEAPLEVPLRIIAE
jgi:hypothetical protein